jgi:hypothetical protein
MVGDDASKRSGEAALTIERDDLGFDVVARPERVPA